MLPFSISLWTESHISCSILSHGTKVKLTHLELPWSSCLRCWNINTALDFSRPLGLLQYAKAFCQHRAVQIVFKIFQSNYVDLPIKKKINRCSLPSALENVRIDDSLAMQILLFFLNAKQKYSMNAFSFPQLVIELC